MDGVIIFADNKVFDNGCYENNLFIKLRSDKTLSVLPVNTISNLEKVLKTMSTFKALILDWNFEQELDAEDQLEGVRLPNTNPQKLLENIDIYSLIYVYSQAEIPEVDKNLLSNKFNNKIRFRTKKELETIEDEYNSIKSDIISFESKHKHMEIPFLWSHTINQSVQTIFNELDNASPNWIKEIRDSAKADGGEPTSEIIEIFHNLLNESLIQNKILRNKLDKYDCVEQVINEENTARLYRRIFYSKLTEDAPIMTGDIFKFDDNIYGILITPECDLINKEAYEFLLIKKDASKRYQDAKKKKYAKSPNDAKGIFNNGVISRHILPSFPFDEQQYSDIAIIDFSTALKVYNKNDENNKCINTKRSRYKLNSPYIHQLRQRFVASFGRYGVPAIPESLRDYNLKQ